MRRHQSELKYLPEPYRIIAKTGLVLTVNGTHLIHALLFDREMPSCSPTLTSLLCHFSIWQVLAVRANLERKSRTYHAAKTSQQSGTQNKHNLQKYKGYTVREEVSGRVEDQGIRVPQRWAWFMPFIPCHHMVLHDTWDPRLGLHLTTASCTESWTKEFEI